MSSIRRVGAVALLRVREGVRGPLLILLLVFLGLGIAAVLLTPGSPGLDRQRAVDGYILQVLRLVLVFAAVILASASLAGDRDAGRDPLLRSTPMSAAEMLVGGFLGHAACLMILAAGMYLGTITITKVFSGGNADRIETRVRLQDSALLTSEGVRVADKWVFLTNTSPQATYEFSAAEADLPFDKTGGGAQAWILLREMLAGRDRDFPDVYPVGLTVGDGPERVLQIRRENPVKFTLSRDDLEPSGALRIQIRRMHPAFVLGVRPGGLVVQGRTRAFALNLFKTILGWFLALLPICAAAAALSTLVGAPVAAAGTLLLVVLAHSHGLFEEASAYASSGQLAASSAGRWVLENLPTLIPNLGAYDFSVSLTERWDITLPQLFERLAPALLGSVAMLSMSWAVLFVRRRL